MQAPEKRATTPGPERLETATGESFEPPAAAAAEAGPDSFWDSLVSFWGGVEPEQRVGVETLAAEEQPRTQQQSWLIEEWDFSAEHGYEPEFEGRSEFEHGEFERWI
jgi:hypothetical protein